MTHNFTRFHREAGAAGAGGNMPLGDLMNNDPNHDINGIESDGFTLKPGFERSPITGAVTKNASYQPPNPGMNPPPTPPPTPPANKVEGLKDDGTLEDGYTMDATTGKPVKDTPAPEETGLNDDGTLKAGFMKDAATGKVVPDPNYVDPATIDEDGTKFIAAVEAITGQKYEVEYPEGVTPASVEGVAIREAAIHKIAQMQFDNYLEQNDPRSYAYMLHRAGGGTDETFFGDNKGFQLPAKTDMEGSADIQSSVYKQELLIKGLDASTAQILVDAAVKDNTLKAKADVSYALLDKAQKDQTAALKTKQENAEKDMKTKLTALTTTITNTIKADIGFIVSETDQPLFQKFIFENMRYDDGQFYFVQPVASGDTLKSTLEALFVQFKKGDMDKIIRKKVQTIAAQNLSRRLGQKNITPGAGANTGNTDKTNLPLSAILPQ